MIEKEFDTSFVNEVNKEIHNYVTNLPKSYTNRARNFHLLHGNIPMQLRHGRLIKKFEQPADQAVERLSMEALERWIATDLRIQGKTEREFYRASRTTNTNLIKVRNLLHNWLGGFKLNLEANTLDFGPGESFISSGGDVSLIAKLSTVTSWTCTRKCFPLFRELVANTSLMRRVVIEYHNPLRVELERNPAFRRMVLEKGVNLSDLALDSALNWVTKFVSGSRFTTVAKDNSKRRPINVEPLGNLLVQKCIGREFRRILKHQGVDLQTGQEKHKKLIESPEVATIDLSDASDSISLGFLKFALPEKIYNLLLEARSPMVRISGTGDSISTGNGEWFRPNKVSSMGNGFTFELLTLVTLAIVRAVEGHDRGSTYGDDIICDNNNAAEIIELLEICGFKVNEEKSFVGKPFKESCGGFTLNGIQLESYDIKWANNPVECFANVNKIYRYAYNLGGPDQLSWRNLHNKLLALIPTQYKGPKPSDWKDSLASYVWTNEQLEQQAPGACHWLGQRFQKRLGDVFSVISFTLREVEVDINKVNHSCESSGFNRRITGIFSQNIRLLTKAKPKRLLRQSEEESKTWEPVRLFFDINTGLITTKKGYDYLRNGERKYLSEIYESKLITRSMWESWTMESDYSRILNSHKTRKGWL